MSANFKKVWYVSCVKCAKQAPLVDGDERKPEVEVLLRIRGWGFVKGSPLCPKHAKEPGRKNAALQGAKLDVAIAKTGRV